MVSLPSRIRETKEDSERGSGPQKTHEGDRDREGTHPSIEDDLEKKMEAFQERIAAKEEEESHTRESVRGSKEREEESEPPSRVLSEFEETVLDAYEEFGIDREKVKAHWTDTQIEDIEEVLGESDKEIVGVDRESHESEERGLDSVEIASEYVAADAGGGLAYALELGEHAESSLSEVEQLGPEDSESHEENETEEHVAQREEQYCKTEQEPIESVTRDEVTVSDSERVAELTPEAEESEANDEPVASGHGRESDYRSVSTAPEGTEAISVDEATEAGTGKASSEIVKKSGYGESVECHSDTSLELAEPQEDQQEDEEQHRDHEEEHSSDEELLQSDVECAIDATETEANYTAETCSHEITQVKSEPQHQESKEDGGEVEEPAKDSGPQSEHVMAGFFPEGEPVIRPMLPEEIHFGLFPETDEERVRRWLMELFESLSEDEKEEVRGFIRVEVESVQELETLIARYPESKSNPDFLSMYKEAVDYIAAGQRVHADKNRPLPRLIGELRNRQAERLWADIVFRGISKRRDVEHLPKDGEATREVTRSRRTKKRKTQDTRASRFTRTIPLSTLRRMYEQAHGRKPEVSIESMKDIDQLLKVHESLRGNPEFESDYLKREAYMAVRNDWSKTQLELSRIYNVPQSTIGKWRSGVGEQSLAVLRRREETRIVREWAEQQPMRELKRLLRSVTDSHNEARKEEWAEELPMRPQRAKHIDLRHLEDALREIRAGRIDTERVVTFIESIYRLSEDESRVHYCVLDDGVIEPDALSELQEVFWENRHAIENGLRESLGISCASNNIRLGITDGRLYIWTPDRDANDLLNSWSSLFFHFRTQGEYDRLVECVCESLELQMEGEGLRHLDRLMDQVVFQSSGQKTGELTHKKGTRVRGEILRFQMDVTGLPTSFLEDRVSRVTGSNGQGGIRNPRFLTGQQLGVLRARLMATANSDFHIRTDGRAEYYEEHMDRIDIFKQTLLSLGEMHLSVVKRRGEYIVCIPLPIGKCLHFWGIPGGDKSLLNNGLPTLMLEAPLEEVCAYAEDLIPQDGCFDMHNGFVWTRFIAIEPGVKGPKYGLTRTLSDNETNLIIGYGTDDSLDRKVISWGKVKQLQFSNDRNIAEPAKSLVKRILDNPSNLLEDEARMIRRLGISIGTKPQTIRYHKKTGKVSVGWVAKTDTFDDAIKWAVLCPPNDIGKRKKVMGFLSAHEEDCTRIKDELIKAGTNPNSGGDAND